jgi:hypothetical protein
MRAQPLNGSCAYSMTQWLRRGLTDCCFTRRALTGSCIKQSTVLGAPSQLEQQVAVGAICSLCRIGFAQMRGKPTMGSNCVQTRYCNGHRLSVSTYNSGLPMPRPRNSTRPCESDCVHDGECECYKVSTGTEQTLAELDFSRSACAAAQLGDIAKLTRMLDRRPDELRPEYGVQPSNRFP